MPYTLKRLPTAYPSADAPIVKIDDRPAPEFFTWIVQLRDWLKPVDTALREQPTYSVGRTNIGDLVRAMLHGDSLTIGCFGDSLTYGWDTTATGTQPGINGSIVTRSSVLGWPEVLGSCLAGAGYPSVSVINYGFGGDTVAMGYERWQDASPVDVAIISYGTNDANGYPDSTTSADEFRDGYVTFIEQKLGQGSFVILTGAFTTTVEVIGLQIRSYNEIIRQLAVDYGLIYVDGEESLRWMAGNRFTDGTHLTPEGYSDFAASMSVLFLGHAGGNVRRIGAGESLDHTTFPLFLGFDYAGLGGTGIPLSRDGTVRHCDNGEFLLFSAFFEDDVYPIITTFTETTSGAQPFTIDFGALLTSGVESITAQNLGTSPYRFRAQGPFIPRGYRRFRLTSTGAGGLNVESIRFVSASDPYAHGTYGLWRKSACSGVMGPNIANEEFAFVDYGDKLTAPFKVKADVKLYDSTNFSGLYFPASMAQFSTAPANYIMVGRNGTDLLVIIDGVTTTVGAAFAAGTFAGTLLVTHSGTQIKVYIDESAVAAATVADTTRLEVFAGVRAEGAIPRFVCTAMIVQD